MKIKTSHERWWFEGERNTEVMSSNPAVSFIFFLFVRNGIRGIGVSYSLAHECRGLRFDSWLQFPQFSHWTSGFCFYLSVFLVQRVKSTNLLSFFSSSTLFELTTSLSLSMSFFSFSLLDPSIKNALCFTWTEKEKS